MCPYYDERYKTCNFYGSTQEGYQKEHYCLSGNEWKRCENYRNRSLDDKVNKRLRPNPEL